MSTLVSWTRESAAPLVKGLWPSGTTYADFEGGCDNESVSGLYISRFKGSNYESLGMTAFEHPVVVIPEIVITGADGFFNAELDNLIADKLAPITITATNSGLPGVWSMPIQSPTCVKYATAELMEGESEMTISISFDEAGDWHLTEDLINRDLPESMQFKFAGVKIKVVL